MAASARYVCISGEKVVHSCCRLQVYIGHTGPPEAWAVSSSSSGNMAVVMMIFEGAAVSRDMDKMCRLRSDSGVRFHFVSRLMACLDEGKRASVDLRQAMVDT